MQICDTKCYTNMKSWRNNLYIKDKMFYFKLNLIVLCPSIAYARWTPE